MSYDLLKTIFKDTPGGVSFYTDGASVCMNYGGDGLHLFSLQKYGSVDHGRDYARQFCLALNRISTLCGVLEHGTPRHRAWLYAAVEAHFTGQPIPKDASNDL